MFNRNEASRALANAIIFEERAASAKTMTAMAQALKTSEEWFALALKYEREALAVAA